MNTMAIAHYEIAVVGLCSVPSALIVVCSFHAAGALQRSKKVHALTSHLHPLLLLLLQ
jgi:hypothetical protein